MRRRLAAEESAAVELAPGQLAERAAERRVASLDGIGLEAASSPIRFPPSRQRALLAAGLARLPGAAGGAARSRRSA